MSAEKKYRGLVIGCGNIAALYESVESRPRPRSHASALNTNPRTELVGFVGLDHADCEKANQFFHVDTYTDVERALTALLPDIVIIAASTSVHESLAITCAEHRIPMIIGEKPLAADMRGAHAIAGAVERSGSTFSLNYQRRFFPLFAEARTRLAAHEIGDIQEVTCLYDNGLFNNGGHAIDSILYLLGSRSVAIEAARRSGITTHPAGDFNVDCELRLGQTVFITMRSHDQKTSPIHELRIKGSRGSLQIRDYGYTFEWNRDNAEPVLQREEVSMTAGVLEDTIAAYEEKRDPKSGIQNGLETLAILEAIRSHVEGGRPRGYRVYS